MEDTPASTPQKKEEKENSDPKKLIYLPKILLIFIKAALAINSAVPLNIISRKLQLSYSLNRRTKKLLLHLFQNLGKTPPSPYNLPDSNVGLSNSFYYTSIAFSFIRLITSCNYVTFSLIHAFI